MDIFIINKLTSIASRVGGKLVRRGECLQSGVRAEGWDPVQLPRERVLAAGVRDERGRRRRHRQHVGEGQQDWVDQHEP